MRLSPNELVALLVATSFAAGLNVYATIATLGLIAHFGLVSLPASLHFLDSWWIIVASAVMFGIEFFADKVPVFDLIWNALHTFIRVPIAAVLAYAAHVSPLPGKATPRDRFWRADCPGCTWGQDRSSCCRDSVAGTYF
jgi:hypothetical protein